MRSPALTLRASREWAVGRGSLPCELRRRGIADIDVRKARGAGIVEESGLGRALAEAQDPGTVDPHEICVRELLHQRDDLRTVDAVDYRAIGEVCHRTAVL